MCGRTVHPWERSRNCGASLGIDREKTAAAKTRRRCSKHPYAGTNYAGKKACGYQRYSIKHHGPTQAQLQTLPD